MKEICVNCEYFCRRKITEALAVIGECRRNSPKPSDNENCAAYWPMVLEDDWCGEWCAPITEKDRE